MPRKILLIEDDADTSDLIEILIREMDTDCIKLPQIPKLEYVFEISPHLVLLDFWVAGEEAGGFCRELKSDKRTNQIPIVIISAINDLEKVALEACADSFLRKPFDITNLQAVIFKYLN